MIMDIVNELHAMYYNVESESDERICQEAIKEIQTLRAEVASADVLVEALEALVDNFKTMENGFNKTLFDKARKALATYDKLSEVKHDTK